MRISHRHRFVFFANPKTGSESVRALLEPFSDLAAPQFRDRTAANPFYSHITPAEARVQFGRLGWDFDGYFRFVMVRNPWERLVSLYEMIYRRPGRIRPGFEPWLRCTRPNGRGGGGPAAQRWRRYGTYSIDAFAGDGHGRELVDAVIRLEHVHSELPPVLERLGVTGRLEHLNRDPGRRQPWQEYYRPATRDLVARRYAADIERFDYRFDA